MKQSLQGWRMPKTLLGYANAAVILKGKVIVIDKSLHSCCLKKRLSYPLITTLPKCHVQPEACFLIGFTELDWIMTLILGWWDLSANQRSCCIMLMTRVQSLEPTMKKSAYSWRLSSDLHKTHTFFFFKDYPHHPEMSKLTPRADALPGSHCKLRLTMTQWD